MTQQAYYKKIKELVNSNQEIVNKTISDLSLVKFDNINVMSHEKMAHIISILYFAANRLQDNKNEVQDITMKYIGARDEEEDN